MNWLLFFGCSFISVSIMFLVVQRPTDGEKAVLWLAQLLVSAIVGHIAGGDITLRALIIFALPYLAFLAHATYVRVALASRGRRYLRQAHR